VVPEAPVVPGDQEAREALEGPAVRGAPVAEVPGAPEEDRVDPAATSDAAVRACGLPGINN